MNDDDLKARLTAIDPVRRGGALDPRTVPPTAEIKELVMQTIDHTRTTPDIPRRGDRRLLAAAAGVVLATAVGLGSWWASAPDESTVDPTPPTTLALSVAPSSVMASCLPFDVTVLSDMPLAFAGTVTAADAGSVTLDVDRWYTGGSADRVIVDVPDQQTSAALDGVELVEDRRYLVTATDGTVNGCGFSGPATPELERAFAEAFPG